MVESKVFDALRMKDNVIQRFKEELEESQIKSLHLEKILDKQRKVTLLYFNGVSTQPLILRRSYCLDAQNHNCRGGCATTSISSYSISIRDLFFKLPLGLLSLSDNPSLSSSSVSKKDGSLSSRSSTSKSSSLTSETNSRNSYSQKI
jgi:hypothetical protein